MALAALWTVTALAATFASLFAHFSHLLTVVECVTLAVPLAFVGSAWLSYVAAAGLFHTLDRRAVLAAFAVQAAIGALHLPALLARMRRARKVRSSPGSGVTSALAARRRAAAPIGATAGAGGALPVIRVAPAPQALAALAIALVTLALVAPMMSTRFVPERDGAVFSGGATWADLPIHLDLINSWLHGTNVELGFDRLESPVYAGSRLVYPFLADFHAAALVAGGASVRHAVMMPAVALAVAGSVLIYLVNVRLTGCNAAAVLSVALVQWAGGTGAFEFALRHGLRYALQSAWHVDPVQGPLGSSGEILWFSYFGHVFMPQRPAAYAMPMSAAVVVLLAGAMEHGVRLADAGALLRAAALLTALLPLFQAHAFLGLVIVCAGLFVLDARRWMAHRELLFRGWLTAAMIGVGVSVVQLPVFMDRVASKEHQFLKVALDAMPSYNGGFWRTWWRALAFQVPLYALLVVLLAVPMARRRMDGLKALGSDSRWALRALSRLPPARQLALLPNYCGERRAWRLMFVLPFAAVFAFSNVVLIQPWVKDNIKLVYFWLLQASGLVAYGLVRAWQRGGRAGKALVPLVVFATVLSGFLGMRREYGGIEGRLFDRAEIETGQWIRQHAHRKSVFLTGESHITPACTIGGRTLWLGYLGWAWSHGMPKIQERHELRNRILLGRERNGTVAVDELRERRISHLLLGPRERHVSYDGIFDDSQVSLFYQNGDWRVYGVHGVVLADRPIESITREAMYASSGVSLICAWLGALMMWYYSRRAPSKSPSPSSSSSLSVVVGGGK